MLRPRSSRSKAIETSKDSIQNDAAPSFRRNRMLLDGKLPQSLSLNGNQSRRSSADTIGESVDNDADTLRPSKRRKRESVISPVESNYSLRGRSKVSPLVPTPTPKPAKISTRSTAVPGIQISNQDESISPVSEVGSIPDTILGPKQSMRFNLNARGGGKLIISNAGTPAASNRGSQRPSPAPDAIFTGANTPEEAASFKQNRKIPGRRRNPHKDPKIEAAIRRQAELKKCYRAMSRAMKPMLIEISTRGINELEEDVEAHENYPEYKKTIAALDYFLEKRLAQLDAQRDWGLRLAEASLKQNSEYVEIQHCDMVDELREQTCMRLMEQLVSQERARGYSDDAELTEDDFEEAIVPLRKPDAYLRAWTDPNRVLPSQFDSRSRKIVITGQVSDHIGRLKDFSGVFKQLKDEMNPELDEEYGNGSPYSDEAWEDEEYDLDAMFPYRGSSISTPTNSDKDGISLLLEAACLEPKDHCTEDSMPGAYLLSSREPGAFELLMSAIDLRHSNQGFAAGTTSAAEHGFIESSERDEYEMMASHETASAPETTIQAIDAKDHEDDHVRKSNSVTISPRKGSRGGSAPVTPAASSRIEASHDSHAPKLDADTGKGSSDGRSLGKPWPVRPKRSKAATQRIDPYKSLPRSSGGPKTKAEQIYERNNSSPTPEMAYLAKLKAIRETPAELQDTFPTAVNWDWIEPENNVARLLNLADYKMDKAKELEYDYYFKVKRGQIKALPAEDEAEMRKLYRQPKRAEELEDKTWLQVRQMKLEHLNAQVVIGPNAMTGHTLEIENERLSASLKDFIGGGKYAHMEIPFEYAKLLVCRDKNVPTINLWEMADKEIPEDAIHIPDRYRFMEMADQVQVFRFSYYYAYWAYHKLCFYGQLDQSAKAVQAREDNFRSLIKPQEIPMREREEEWGHAMKTWTFHKASREGREKKPGKQRMK